MITLYNYEDKTQELVKEKCLQELNVNEEDLLIKEEEVTQGLFKNKKIQLTILKIEQIIWRE